MTVTTRVTADELGKIFADAVRSEPHVTELSVSTQPDGFNVWAIVEPISLAEERRLRGLADMLYRRFPSGEFEVHIVNPRRYARNVRVALPVGAEKVAI